MATSAWWTKEEDDTLVSARNLGWSIARIQREYFATRTEKAIEYRLKKLGIDGGPLDLLLRRQLKTGNHFFNLATPDGQEKFREATRIAGLI